LNSLEISVIICCHNSSLQLEETITHLQHQQGVEKISWELIVVNNGSTDATKYLLDKLYKAWPLQKVPFIILEEPQLGLSYARHCGISNSSGALVIFCDDDNSLDQHYLINAYLYLQEKPNVGVLGGVGIARFSIPEPKWWSFFSKSYAIGPQAIATGEVSLSRNYVYGAGMIIRREVLDLIVRHQFYSLLQDRSGNSLSSGGDVELCYLAKYLGYQIHYSDRLTFIHRLADHRITWNYYLQLKRGISQSYRTLRIYNFFFHKRSTKRNFFFFYFHDLMIQIKKLWFHKEPDQYKREIQNLMVKISLKQWLNIFKVMLLYFKIKKRYQLAQQD